MLSTRLTTPCRAVLRLSALAGHLCSPWLTLLLRIALAQAFLHAELAELMLGTHLAAPLGGHWWWHAAHHIAASSIGTAVQALCPLLLLIGLFARPAAIAMLLQVVVVPPSGMSQGVGLLWSALLSLIILSGPGGLSFDRLFAPGASASPVPLARRLAGVYRLLGRIEPIYRAMLRVLAAVAAAPLALAGPLHMANLPAMLPAPMLWLLAALLALGAATPLVALILLTTLPFLHTTSDARLFGAFLLAILIVRGAGVPSLDVVLRRACARLRTRPDASLSHVVIVGAGFGGIAAAQALASAPCRITLIDRTNYTLFQPLLYQVATAGLSPAEIATPIRSLFRAHPLIDIRLGDVTGIDTAARHVQLQDAVVAYDYLIIATGARHAYLGHDDWAPNAPGLKSIEDATDIRRRLLLAFERAENATDSAERAAWLTFVVVGAGPTGVELAGAISELAQFGLTDEFRSIDPADARILLVQSGERVLPSFAPALSAAALNSLKERKVDIRLNNRIEGVSDTAVIVAGQSIPTRTVLWAAGVMASPAAIWLNVTPDKAGRVPVAPDLSVPGHPEMFVIGDTAASLAWNGNLVPGLAPAAKQGGAYAARVIAARLAHKPAPPAFRYRDYGSLATIGRDSAVAEFGRIHVKGALAWWLWGIAHIAFLANGRNRAAIVLDWAWAYLTFRRSTRLITFPPK